VAEFNYLRNLRKPKFIERQFSLPGMILAAKCWGDPQSVPVLAVHGWMDNAASFDSLAPYLSDYYMVALDLPGHGFSSHRPVGVRYHILDYVGDVLRVADHLGWERFSLMGHSMGAGIASYVAAVASERIDKLILIDGIGTLTTAAEEAPNLLAEAIRDMKKEGQTRLTVYPDMDDAVRARQRAVGIISREAAAILCERGMKPVAKGFVWKTDPKLRMASAMRLTENMVESFLKKIKAPVLLLTGRDSFFQLAELFGNRIDCVKDIEIEEMEGGHHLHLEPETAQGVAVKIVEFLGR
jgi:pimeloyl-ACP methyl ester carboxylesterase